MDAEIDAIFDGAPDTGDDTHKVVKVPGGDSDDGEDARMRQISSRARMTIVRLRRIHIPLSGRATIGAWRLSLLSTS